MRKIQVAIMAAALAMLMVPSAKATLLLYGDADFSIVQQVDPLDRKAIADAMGIRLKDLGPRLYKQVRLGSESGTLADSYGATYYPSPESGLSVLINYTGGAYADATYLLVKDGTEGSLVWSISNWNGTEDILVVSPFINHKIGFVEFFGTPVPEPTTMIAGALLLLPFGVSTLRILRKRQTA